MDDGVHEQLLAYTEQQQLISAANSSSLSNIIHVVTSESTQAAAASAAVMGGAALRSGSPWLWAPHVAIGALLLLLMAASFVRFHCKYGHKYRTGSQSFSSTLRLAPKSAWTLDKKMSATSLPRSRSGHGLTATKTVSGLQGRRAARPAAVIVLKPVTGGGRDHTAAASNISRHSVISAGDSTTTVDEVDQSLVRSTGSTISMAHGQFVESTTLDIDLMSTSRGSDEDWTTFGLASHSAAVSAPADVSATDPWLAIKHHENAASSTVTPTAIVGREHRQTDDQQTLVNWTGIAATSNTGTATGWWQEETSNATRMSDMFPALNVFRHPQTSLHGVTGVPDDTERLIDDANDRSIL